MTVNQRWPTVCPFECPICTNITHIVPIFAHYYSPVCPSLHLYLLFSFTFSLLLFPPPLLPRPPPFQFPTKWCHQSLLRPLPRFIMQSASGCSYMPLYGLTVSARGQAGEFIHHDSNALSQCSTLQPGPAPEWPGRTQTCLIRTRTCTHRKSSLQTSKVVFA